MSASRLRWWTRFLSRDLREDGKGVILAVVSAGNFFTLGSRLIYPALLPAIIEAFALSLTTAGLVLTVLGVSIALAQLPGGFLADRYGERAALVTSVGGTAVGLGLVAVAPVFWVFVVGTVVFGLATGLYGTPRITVLHDIYPARSGTFIGILLAVGSLGTAVMPVVAAAVAGWVVWQAGFAFVIPAFVVVGVGMWVLVPRRTSPPLPGGSMVQTARAVVASVVRRPVLMATVMMLGMSVIYQGFTGFLPTFLVEEKGFGAGRAATVLGVFFVSAVVLQPVAGGIADRYGSRAIMAGLAGVTVVTVGLFPLVGAPAAVFGLALVAGAQLAFWPPMFAYITGLLPGSARGSGFGLLRTGFLLAGASGPVVVGAFADAGLFNEAFFLLAGVAAVTAVLAVLLPARS